MTPKRLAEIKARSGMASAAEKGMGFSGLSEDEARELVAEVERLHGLINNPHTEQFLKAVRLEAAHQRERWGDAHDRQKSDADFFWTLGWLAGKAVRFESQEKRLHHIVTSAALCLNWHRLAKESAAPAKNGGTP